MSRGNLPDLSFTFDHVPPAGQAHLPDLPSLPDLPDLPSFEPNTAVNIPEPAQDHLPHPDLSFVSSSAHLPDFFLA
jgi:hypothetical protein